MFEQQTTNRGELSDIIDIIKESGSVSLTPEQAMRFISLVISSPSDLKKLKDFYNEPFGKSLLARSISADNLGMTHFVRVYLEEKIGISRSLALIMASLPQIACALANSGKTDKSPADNYAQGNFAEFIRKYRWQYDPNTLTENSEQNTVYEQNQTQNIDLEQFVWSLFRGSVSERILLTAFAPDYTLTSCDFVQNGTDDNVSIDTNRVARMMKRNGSKFLIIAHNHPSDNPMPSRADLQSTRSLFISMKSIGVTLIDHFIITSTFCTSVRMIYNFFDTTIIGLNDGIDKLYSLEAKYLNNKT